MKAKILWLLAVGLLAVTGSANAASISLNLDIINPSSTQTFYTVSFQNPIAPLTGLNSYSFTGSISLTDATGNGVSALPGGQPEFWRLEAGNGSLWSVVDDVGGTASLTSVGPFNFAASGLFDCTAALTSCSWLRLTIGFGLSGFDDQLSSAATFTLLPPSAVPEPGTLVLLGLGLTGLGLGRRRKAA